MHNARFRAIALATILAIPFFAQAAPQDPQQDPLSKPISFSMKAASVDKIVAEVAKKLDMKLEVAPSMRSEVLIVAVDNVTGKQLLDKIAAASVGVWVQDRDIMRLQRNFAQVTREDREALQASTARFRKEIKDLWDSANGRAKKPAGQGEDFDMGAMFGGGSKSGTKAIAELLQGVDPSLLASLQDGERLVYASPNTRMQRPIPGNVANVISAWVAEHNKEAKAREAQKQNETEVEENMKELEEFLKIFGISEPKTVDDRPAKVILVFTKGFLGMPMMPIGQDSVTVDLKLYNSKGQVILRGSHSLGLDMEDFQELANRAQPPKEAKPQPSEQDTKIEFSKPAKDLMTMFGGAMQGNLPQMDKELEEMLLQPNVYEPLSFAHSEALLAIAKAKDLDVVANLPDSELSFMSLIFGGQNPATVNAYLNALKANKALWVTTEGTWLSITPKNPTTARAIRTNRTALSKLLSVVRKGTPTLDDIAAYALEAEAPTKTPVAQTYLMLFAPTAIQQGLTGMTDWDALRFYGTMTPGQKETIANNGQLPFGNLNPKQRDLVAKMAFGSAARLQVGSEAKPATGGFLGMITQFLPTADKDYRQEPTEVMPDGLPMAGYVTGSIKQQFIGSPAGQGMGMLSRASLGTDELAMFEWMKSDPMFAQAMQMMPQITQLRPGKRTNYAFSFFVAKDVLFNRTLNDDRFEKNAEPISMTNLPQDVQDEIKKKVEELKKTPLPFGGFGGGVKPPLF